MINLNPLTDADLFDMFRVVDADENELVNVVFPKDNGIDENALDAADLQRCRKAEQAERADKMASLAPNWKQIEAAEAAAVEAGEDVDCISLTDLLDSPKHI